MTQPHSRAHFQRAIILHQQRRFTDAERELRQVLALDPSDPEAHAMLAMCMAELKDLPQATAEAQQAIGLAPDLPFAHYVLARVMSDRNRPEEALTAIEQSLALDGHNPAYFAMLAAIRLDLRQWPAALEAASKGLAIDPENERCVNLRAIALVKLGRRDEAGAAIGAVLARDPEDAMSHANQGWTLLHKGEHRQAMVHFREALRLDPEMQWARAGMVESLKARNPIYRIMLAYFLFMARLSSRAQWGIIVGGYFVNQVLNSLAASNPALRPLVLPVIFLYVGFAIMTWVADPLFNLMLRLDRFGRYALSPKQIWSANCTGATLLIALALAAMAWVFRSPPLFFAALGGLFFMIPVVAIFKAPEGWPRYALLAYAVALGILGITALAGIIPAAAAHVESPPWAQSVGTAFFWGALIHQFVANALFGVRVRK